MYFWKIDALKQQLCSTGLSEKQLFYYILASVALNAVAVEALTYLPTDAPNAWTYASSAIDIAIPIGGTVLAFRVNGGASGVQFAARYFSIGLVATLRFIALFVPLMAALLVYWFATADSATEAGTTGLEVTVCSGWYAGLYLYIAKHVRAVVAASVPAAEGVAAP